MRCIGLRAKAPQYGLHAHVRQRPTTLLTWKDEIFCAFQCLHLGEDRKHAVRQWNTVLPTSLHTPGRNDPHPGRGVDFRPAGTPYLTGSGSGQNGEFEGASRNPVQLPQLADKGRHLVPGHGNMVAPLKFWAGG